MKRNTFSTEFRKILKYQMKMCPVNAELFHADRETEMTKLKSLKSLVLATSSVMTTIFNSLVTEKKGTNNGLILNCTAMVALLLTAAGTVGNILTKSKVYNLYFRTLTITSVVGQMKLQNCTKFRHYETF